MDRLLIKALGLTTSLVRIILFFPFFLASQHSYNNFPTDRHTLLPRDRFLAIHHTVYYTPQHSPLDTPEDFRSNHDSLPIACILRSTENTTQHHCGEAEEHSGAKVRARLLCWQQGLSRMANATYFDLPPLPHYELKPQQPLISWLPDAYLTLALPVIAYWAVSLFFHCIDELDLFPQYRLHTPAEVLKRNHVSRWDVFRDVIIQQVIQTVVGVGLTVFDPEPTFGKEDYDIAWWAQNLRLAQRAIPAVLASLGVDAVSIASNLGPSHGALAAVISGGMYQDLTQTVRVLGEPVTAPAFAQWELLAAKGIYHYGIPALQFFFAIMIVDTWQYFLHRAMHMNKWLYVKFHSRHHRLYVPYAYGALYNHPFEGFLLDTLGTGIAYLISGMTVRQSMWFFTMSTIKTVDDHCGYAFPWDPLQHVTSNNAGYHDVHHQSWGIKTNFSQPFFTFWDGLLGTKWTGGDVSARYERAKIAAQKKVDADIVSNNAQSAAPYTETLSQASSTARTAQGAAEPKIPAGKATYQAIGSRQQVLEDPVGGISVLAEENAEEIKAQQKLRSTPRTRTTESLKEFADRVGESLQGKGTGMLGVESRSRR